MTEEARLNRILKIQPGDLALWTKLCHKVNKQVASAHPDYPRLDDMQLLSFVKRLLPELRAMISSVDRSIPSHSTADTISTQPQQEQSPMDRRRLPRGT
jgi:hypothetical protein